MKIMWMRSFYTLPTVILCCMTIGGRLAAQNPAEPTSEQQSVARSLWLGADLGLGFYFGEFNSLEDLDAFSPAFGYDISLAMRYAISDNIAISGEIGKMGLGYDVTGYVKQKYASNFFGSSTATTYPGSTIPITEQNSISMSKYMFYLQAIFPIWKKWHPFAVGGLGVVGIDITNDNDQALPTNFTGTYSDNAFTMAVGGGVNYVINKSLTAHGRLMVYLTNTDYLDGYAHYLDYETTPGIPGPGTNSTLSDHAVGLTVGISFKIYQAPQDEPEEQKPQNPPVASGRDGRDGRDGKDGRDGQDGRSGQDGRTRQDSMQADRNRQPAPDKRQAMLDSIAREEDRFRDSLARAEAGLRDSLVQADSRRRDSLAKAEAKLRDSLAAAVSRRRDSLERALADQGEPSRGASTPSAPSSARTPGDSDGDGLSDEQERNVYKTSLRNRDSDGDALTDGEEVTIYKTDPTKNDTDGDGVNDGAEIYSYRSDPLAGDSDRDGLSDGEEVFIYRTDSRLVDTDGDGVPDGEEVTRRRTNPLVSDVRP